MLNEIFTSKNIELMAGALGALALAIRFSFKLIKVLIEARKEEELNMTQQIANIRTDQIAAATAIVGYNLLTNERDARVPYARKLDTIAYVGSAAAGDTVVELFIQGQSVGKYANSSTGVSIDRQKDCMPLDLTVYANQIIEAKVIDAAGTNPVVLQLEFSKPEYTGRKSSRRWGSSGRRSTGARSTFPRSSGMF